MTSASRRSSLPFTVIHAGTDAAMFAELDSAYQRKAPIMLWIYSPHWAPAKYEGEWIEFPEHTPECYTDPKAGPIPTRPMIAASRMARSGNIPGRA